MTKNILDKLKERCTVSNFLFIFACLFLLIYSKDFIIFPGKYLIGFTLIFVLINSLYIGKFDFDLRLLFLAEAFLNKGILDLHAKAFELVPIAMISPVLMYMLGKVIATNREGDSKQFSQILKCNVAFIALTIGMTVGALKVINGGNRPILLFELSFAICVVAALINVVIDKLLDKKESIKKILIYIGWIIIGILAVIFMRWYFCNDRFALLKEGFGMLMRAKWGGYGVDYIPPTYSTMMWLDYAGHYGQLICFPIYIFEVFTVIDTVKLARNKNVSLYTRTILIMSFVFTNMFYFLEGIPYSWPCFWYIGLVINGMISVVARYEK